MIQVENLSFSYGSRPILRDISFSMEPQPVGTKLNAGRRLYAVAHPVLSAMRCFVQQASLNSMLVFLPCLFKMNKRALPRAKRIMLERGQHDIGHFTIVPLC